MFRLPKTVKKSNKSDATSPTVYTELVLITNDINETEYPYITVIDVPREFLTADIDEKVILVLGFDLNKIMEAI